MWYPPADVLSGRDARRRQPGAEGLDPRLDHVCGPRRPVDRQRVGRIAVVERLGHDDVPVGLEGEPRGQPVVEGVGLPQVLRAERLEEPRIGLPLLPIPHPGLGPQRRDVGSQIHPDGEEVRRHPHDRRRPASSATSAGPRERGRARAGGSGAGGSAGRGRTRRTRPRRGSRRSRSGGAPRRRVAASRRRRPRPATTRARRSRTAPPTTSGIVQASGPGRWAGWSMPDRTPRTTGKQIDGQDPRGLEPREVPLEARAGRHRRPVVGEVVDPEGQAPEEERADAEPRRSPERQARLHQEQGQQGGDERVHDLEVEVEAQPPGETHGDRDPAPCRLGERPGEPERGAEEHDLADEEMLDVVRPGQRVVRRDVRRHHGGEENAQETGPAAEEDAAGAVDGQTRARACRAPEPDRGSGARSRRGRRAERRCTTPGRPRGPASRRRWGTPPGARRRP